SGTIAGADLSAASCPGDPAAGGAHLDPGDGWLPGATYQVHGDRLLDRLRRADPRRPVDDQRHLRSDDDLSAGRATVLSGLLAAVAGKRGVGTKNRHWCRGRPGSVTTAVRDLQQWRPIPPPASTRPAARSRRPAW